MDGNTMTPADIAALTKNGNNSYTDSGFMWLVLFILIAMGGRGGNQPAAPVVMPASQSNGVTQAELTAGLNNSQIQNQLMDLQLATAGNDLNTVNAINQQTQALLQRDYSNGINILSGYNNINTAVNNQTYQISSKIDNLSFKMDQCCGALQRQMLEDRNADLQSLVTQLQNQISNFNQTQQILGTQGRWVAWTPSGTAEATRVTAAA